MRQRKTTVNWVGRAARAGALGLSLTTVACDDLLEVELTHLLTDEALSGQATAQLQVTSAIALFECGSSTFSWIALGHEDVLTSIAGVTNTSHVYRDTPVAGTCDTTSGAQAWFDQFQGARMLLSTDPALLTPAGKTPTAQGYLGRGPDEHAGVYDKLNNGSYNLDAGENDRLSAIAAIYMGAVMSHYGQFYCEGAIDGSEPYTPDDFLDLADQWLGRAQTHVTAFGDFGLPNGAASSAQNALIALRAVNNWANGDLAAADADAAAVLTDDDEFTFWVTREGGEQRRNKIRHAATESRYSGMLGPINFWSVGDRTNPVTGLPWPDPIPFTGYIFLGIGPEGETLAAGNTPVTYAARVGGAVVPHADGSVQDTRVTHAYGTVQGPGSWENPTYYANDAEDEPYVSWRELTLIRAEYAHSTNDLQGAIDFVNGLRVFHGLQEIEGAYETALLGDADAVRAMLLEERRRELYSQSARYWSTKIQNVDMLWFPRRSGQSPTGYVLQGGVRMPFPADEYELNPNFAALGDLTDVRGTFCDPNEAPVF